MLRFIKNELNLSIITSIVYFILGIIIIINPGLTIGMFSALIAILSIIYGVTISIINIVDIKSSENLVLGILLIILGIILLIYPGSLSILISLSIGIWFISSSVNRIKIAILLKGVEKFNWLMVLFSAIITLLVGMTFIFSPLVSAITLTIFGGILMMVYSLCNIFEIIVIKKNIKTIEKALEQAKKWFYNKTLFYCI